MDIIEKIKGFFIEKDYMNSDLTIDESDSLMESGILDSIATMNLVDYLEKEFSLEVTVDDLTPENFDSFLAIKKYIQSKSE